MFGPLLGLSARRLLSLGPLSFFDVFFFPVFFSMAYCICLNAEDEEREFVLLSFTCLLMCGAFVYLFIFCFPLCVFVDRQVPLEAAGYTIGIRAMLQLPKDRLLEAMEVRHFPLLVFYFILFYVVLFYLLFYFILFYFILFYFVLFYFILFYFKLN